MHLVIYLATLGTGGGPVWLALGIIGLAALVFVFRFLRRG